jgi:hypothetical protein
MNHGILATVGIILLLPLASNSFAERKSLLQNDPDVVYLSDVVKNPIMLKVIKEAPVYADKNGNTRVGFIKADQTVELEEMTERAYKVRGEGTRNRISGWVAPWAFSHEEEDFATKLKQLYERQIAVSKIIKDNGVAIGMTTEEVSASRGEPTKTSQKRTATGQSATWEYIDFDDVKHYITRYDPNTGQAYRQFSHVTREETGKTVIQFVDGLVTELEESESKAPGNVRIIVPPLVFRW